MREAMEDSRDWGLEKQEAFTSFRAMSPTSVLGGPVDGQLEDGHCLELPNWSNQWQKSVDGALSGWSSWEIPAPHGFWHAPHLAPDDMRAGYQGTAAYILSIFACFPQSARAGRGLADHLYSFWQWDDWLKRYARHGEAADFAAFLRHAAVANESAGGRTEGGRQYDGSEDCRKAQLGWGRRPARIGEEAVGMALRTFPLRLDRKYPCKKEEFLAVLADLAEGNSSDGSSPVSEERGGWLPGYMSGWRLYAEEGLTRHGEIRDACREGVAVDPEAFLVYRALSSPLWLLFGAASAGCSSSPDKEELPRDVLALLAQAAMLAALHSDLLLAARNKGATSASISALLLFSPNSALRLHSVLRVAYAKTRAQVLESLGGAAGGEAVETMEACTYGLIRWYDFARKHEPLVSHDTPQRLFTSGSSSDETGESQNSDADDDWDAHRVVNQATATVAQLAANTFSRFSRTGPL